MEEIKNSGERKERSLLENEYRRQSMAEILLKSGEGSGRGGEEIGKAIDSC